MISVFFLLLLVVACSPIVNGNYGINALDLDETIEYYVSLKGKDESGCGNSWDDACKSLGFLVSVLDPLAHPRLDVPDHVASETETLMTDISTTTKIDINMDTGVFGAGNYNISFSHWPYVRLHGRDPSNPSIIRSENEHDLPLVGFSVAHSESLIVENMQFERFTHSAFAVRNTSLLIKQSNFYNNHMSLSESGAVYVGGGLYITDCTNVTIIKSIFANNTATNGGAICSQNSVLYLTDTIISDNVAIGSGGGLFVDVGDTAIVHMQGGWFGNNSAQQSGGAMYQTIGDVYIDLTHFDSNTAGLSGGGFYIAGGKATTNHATFQYNECKYSGGAINVGINGRVSLLFTTFNYNSGLAGGALSFDSTKTLCVDHCTFVGNSGTERGNAMFITTEGEENLRVNVHASRFADHPQNQEGGVISISGVAQIFINASEFEQNAATSGGVMEITENSLVVLYNCTLAGNTAHLNGGAIELSDFGRITVVDTEFRHNSCPESGGAIYATQSSFVNITGSMFKGNVATLGGALNIESNIRMEAVTFDSNVALASEACRGGDGFGGAIYFMGFQCSTWVNGMTEHDIVFTDNHAMTAGGVFFFGSMGVPPPNCVYDLRYTGGGNSAPYGNEKSTDYIVYSPRHNEGVLRTAVGIPMNVQFDFYDDFGNQLQGDHFAINMALTCYDAVVGDELSDAFDVYIGGQHQAIPVVDGTATFYDLQAGVTRTFMKLEQQAGVVLTFDCDFPLQPGSENVTLLLDGCDSDHTLAPTMKEWNQATQRVHHWFVCSDSVLLTEQQQAALLFALTLILFLVVISLIILLARRNIRSVFVVGADYLACLMLSMILFLAASVVMTFEQVVISCYIETWLVSIGNALMWAVVIAKLSYFAKFIPPTPKKAQLNTPPRKPSKRSKYSTSDRSESTLSNSTSSSGVVDGTKRRVLFDVGEEPSDSYHELEDDDSTLELVKQPDEDEDESKRNPLLMLRTERVKLKEHVLLIVGIDLLLLICWFLFAPFRISDQFLPVCESDMFDFFYNLVTYYKLSLLAYSCYLAIRVKFANVTSYFHETTFLLAVVLNYVAVGIISLLDLNLSNTKLNAVDTDKIWAFTIILSYVSLSMWLIMVVPQLWISPAKAAVPIATFTSRERQQALDRLLQAKKREALAQLEEEGVAQASLQEEAKKVTPDDLFSQEDEIYGTSLFTPQPNSLAASRANSELGLVKSSSTFGLSGSNNKVGVSSSFGEEDILEDVLMQANNDLMQSHAKLKRLIDDIQKEKRALATSFSGLALLKWEATQMTKNNNNPA